MWDRVLAHKQFIQGPEVFEFEEALAKYLNVKHVITCANGTDALQLVYMALDLDIVHTPAFNNFTIKVKDRSKYQGRVYYPIPLHKTKAYRMNIKLPVSEKLCKEVISITS
jgi:dTDP-4-amino-4,6-dideoxygalactose transaminase